MHAGRRSLTVFAFFLAAFGAPTASAQEAKVLLEEARDRHRAAIEAIRTVTYSYERQELKSESLHHENTGASPIGVVVLETGPGQYWQSPEAQRRRTLMSDGSTVDEVFRFGRLLRAQTAKKNDPDRNVKMTLETCSTYQLGGQLGILFEHPSRDGEYLPFHLLVQQPHQVRAVERLPAKAGGRPGEIRVELAHDRGVYEFWFGPSYNYLIRKRVEHPIAQPHHRYESEVSEFAEPNPGQFFPARIDYRSFEGEELKQHDRKTLSDVQINRPIPGEAFRIPGIDGGLCEDLTQKVGFRVDADGYRVGNAQAFPFPVEPVRTKSPTPATPTDQSVSFWVGLAISVLALCLCAALFEIRQLRAELRKKTIAQ